MKSAKTLYLVDRDEWRRWLEENYDKENEIWLIYYKKHTGKPSIPYDDAVEEALCFGWIDSTVRHLDDEKYVQRFTSRKPKSKWNQRNIERAKKMIKLGRMTESGLKKFNERVEYDEAIEILEPPVDMEKALEADKTAWENFNNFAPSYRKIYIYWVTSAKREETRKRRIKEVVKHARLNQKPGMM